MIKSVIYKEPKAMFKVNVAFKDTCPTDEIYFAEQYNLKINNLDVQNVAEGYGNSSVRWSVCPFVCAFLQSELKH